MLTENQIGKVSLAICCGVWLPFASTEPVSAQAPTFAFANSNASFFYRHTLVDNFRPSRFYGTGPAAADYDNDGDIDMFLPQAYGLPDELYRNNGDGTFTEVAAAVGVAGLKEARCALWFDYNDDGWLDLFVAFDPDAPPGQPAANADPTTAGNVLYRNDGDGTFTDVTPSAGDLGVNHFALPAMALGGVAAGDIDGDSDLDLYLSCWNCQNALYRNNGDGTFTERAVAARVASPSHSWAPMFCDIDRDGDQDLLVNADFFANHLFINNGMGNFVDAAGSTGFNTAFNEMGMAIIDYDRDGDLDVYSSNIESPFPLSPSLTKYSVLMRNDTVGQAVDFTEYSDQAGVRRTGWGWGCTWIDGTNDRHVDLAVTNGWSQGPYATDQSCYFNNTGQHPFAETGTGVGFAQTLQGRGLIALDYDLDGDLDLCETNTDDFANLFENVTPNAGNWIQINLIGPRTGNRFAVGAEISVTTGTVTQRRLVSAGTSFLSQEPYRQHFGLADATLVDRVLVRWPNGTQTVVEDITINRVATISITDGLLPDMNLDRKLDSKDIAPFVLAMIGQPIRPMDLVIADLNGDGSIDANDIAAFVTQLID